MPEKRSLPNDYPIEPEMLQKTHITGYHTFMLPLLSWSKLALFPKPANEILENVGSRPFFAFINHYPLPLSILLPWIRNIITYSTPIRSSTTSRISNTPKLHPKNIKLLPFLAQRLIPKRQTMTTDPPLKTIIKPQPIMSISSPQTQESRLA